MNRIQTFQDFLTTQSAQVSIPSLVFNLILAALLSFVLSFIYQRFGAALSNRRAFARNFVPLTMTTMLIIMVVKSSLALSLGLVGALSIVRFRAAIKEPEELAYLFLCIAIGLGLGADQTVVTVVAFVLIAGVLVIRSWRGRGRHGENLHLTIHSQGPNKIDLDDIVGVLDRRCTAVNLRRVDQTGDVLEASFLVEFENFDQLKSAKNDLRGLGEGLSISIIDTKGLS